MFITPTPISRQKRLLGRLIRRREHRLATFICVLSIFLCGLLGLERYQAKEIQLFIEETERRQSDASWIIHLASVRRQERMERWSADYPPRASDHADSHSAAVQVSLRPSAPALDSSMPVLSSSSSAAQRVDSFPAFDRAVYPVSRVPNWGAMRTAAEWDRPYGQMPSGEFVPLPSYNLQALKTPLRSLVDPIKQENIPLLTAKLFYSTRYYGAYDLDAGEFSGLHPGIDLKLAFGTPIGSIGGGRVHAVQKDAALGLYVMIEHRLPTGETLFSIYGHLDTVNVRDGQDIAPGQIIGSVGMTGNTTAAHVHLQIDRDDGTRPHQRYWPAGRLSRADANRHTVHPIEFILQHRA